MTDGVLQWFQHQGGSIHKDVKLNLSEEYGCQFIATSKLEDNTTVCFCPLGLTLSYLNCLPNPPAGVRSVTETSVCGKLVGKVETNAVATFLLVEERLKGSRSFWADYINLLPREQSLATPLWFTTEDLVWLRGTNLFSSVVSESQTAVGLRKSMYEEAWKAGTNALDSQGVDSTPFTWELCLWAATMFSSRSFTSKIMTQSEGDSFSLLYPVIDYFNHRFGEKVSWNMEKGDFSLVLASGAEAGEQVFNNYAPKGNEELLMGYGFCTLNNPCDQVLLRLARPPQEIHAALKARVSNHFKSDSWSAEESAFYIRGSSHYSGGYADTFGLPCLRGIPLELVLAIQTFVSFSFDPEVLGDNYEEELWFGTLDALLHRLQQKRDAIKQWDSALPAAPQNIRQKFAKIYRDGQLGILCEVIGELEKFLHPIEKGERTLMESFRRPDALK